MNSKKTGGYSNAQADGLQLTQAEMGRLRAGYEAALAAERNTILTLINTIPERIFVKDRQGRFILNNTAHLQALGVADQAEALGKTDYDFRPTELSERYWQDDRLVMDEDHPLINHEEPTLLPDGEPGTLLVSKAPLHNASGEVIGMVGASRDISAFKRAEQAMRESERRFANAFQYAAIGMGMASPAGRWLRVNDSLCRMLGYSAAELLEISVQELTYAEDLAATREFYQQLLSGAVDSYQLEKRYLHKAGRLIWCKISCSLVRGDQGDPLYTIAQIEDISRQKRLERELRSHAAKLEEMVERRTQELFSANQELTAMNEEIIAMNETLADANRSLAVEIEVRQTQENAIRLREKQYRASVGLLTSSREDYSELLQNILQDAIALVGAPGGDISLLDDTGKNFVFHHSVGINREVNERMQSADAGMLGELLTGGELLYVEDYRRYSRRLNQPKYERVTTGLAVPLTLGGRIAGALTATWQDEVHALAPDDTEILRQFGALASIVLERTHARKRISRQNELLRELAAITAQLVNELDLDRALRMTLEQAVAFLGIPHGFIQLYAQDGCHACFKCGAGRYAELVGSSLRFDDSGVLAEVLRTGRAVYIDNYSAWPQRMRGTQLAEEMTAALQAPLRMEGRIIGSIGLAAFGEPFTVDAEMRAAFEQFATIAAIAVKNAMSLQEANRLAFHDALTGLPNRAHLNQRLETEMELARRGESAGAVMFVDLDDLKTVNDHFGHSFGDSVIIAAGRDIAAAVGEEAYVARVGGDEFVVLLPGADLRQVSALAEQLVDTIRKEYEVRGQSVHMSTSVGITLYPVHAATGEEALKNADIAMYAAKATGKNTWRLFEPEMQKETYDQLVLTNSLRRALENGELYLEYQPQLSLVENRVAGFEALLRWNSRKHGQVPPARFIPLAEQRGLIQPIGEWVIAESCRFARQLAQLGKQDLHVAVNVSPRQLAATNFVDLVFQNMEAAGIEPRQLEIEITESVLIDSVEDSTAKLCDLSSLGVRLSLDDFGTGYSSLTYLRTLPVSTLKIDKSFIDKILDSKLQEGLVRSIVDMAHLLGLNVVAEGVETELQMEKLIRLGCDCVQGYVFSRPVSPTEAVRLATIVRPPVWQERS